MASTITPVQTRYNDPYQQTIFQYNTADSKVYLSRESNQLLNVVGNDIVIKDMNMSGVSIVSSSTVRATIGTGWAIQDSTLLQFTNSNNVDIDCAALDDTSLGCHLAVFIKYEFLQTIEANLAAIDIFHIQADGTVTNPLARHSTASCRILLGIIDFYKTGAVVTSAIVHDGITLNVAGTLMTLKGQESSHLNLPNLFEIAFREYREYLLKRDYLLSA